MQKENQKLRKALKRLRENIKRLKDKENQNSPIQKQKSHSPFFQSGSGSIVEFTKNQEIKTAYFGTDKGNGINGTVLHELK